MSKPVVKLAQPGFDVKKAADQNLIYSSDWPLLKIYQTGTFKTDFLGATTGAETVIARHDLGYIPVYWIFSNQPIESWHVSQTKAVARRSEYGGYVSIFQLPSMYKDKLSLFNSLDVLNHYISLRYYIFALDLEKQYNAPIINVGTQPHGRKGKTVFKLAKPTKDISSTNLEDYIIHSDTRSPLIHSVNPGIVNQPAGASQFSFTVNHNLGYIPMFFVYFKNADGSYAQGFASTGGSSTFSVDEQKIKYTTTGSSDVLSIVVLKDPFIVDESASVTI